MRSDWMSKGPKPCLHHLAFSAMNCDMAAWVLAVDRSAACEHLEAVRQFMSMVEARLSRFRSESELCQLNARPGEAVPVSALMWEVTVCALRGAEDTGGLYDPTILGALEAAGYDRTFAEVVDDRRRPRPVRPRRRGWREIDLDGEAHRVTLPPGVRLDLGGIAKAWAADRAADRLFRLGPCLVDAGGDIAVRGGLPGAAGWPIGVADPRHGETDLALLLIGAGGVATSGVDYRQWRRGDNLQHHIIDPRLGRPAETDLLTVTVVGPSAMQADVHALAALILGARQGNRYLRAHPTVEGLLVRHDGARFATPGFMRYVPSIGGVGQ
jgi:thiamine biosynthesis lipoprotein